MYNPSVYVKFNPETSNAFRKLHLIHLNNFAFYKDIGVFVEDLTDTCGSVCKDIMFTRRASKEDCYYFSNSFLTTSQIESIRFAECRDKVFIVLATENGNKIFETVADTSPARPQVDTSFKLCNNVI